MNLGFILVGFGLLIIALVLLYYVTYVVAHMYGGHEVQPQPLVPVNEESRALYDKLLELGGPAGLPIQRVSRGAIEFVERYSGYYPEGCRLMSAKLVGTVPKNPIVSADCTHKLHVMANFRLRDVKGESTRLDADFLIDLLSKTAVLYVN